MKQFVFTGALALFVTSPVAAQDAGKITYEERVSFDLPVIEGVDSAMLANIPRESKNVKELYYTSEASLYQNAPEKPKDDMLEEQQGIVIKMGQSNDKVYTSFTDKKTTEQRDFMSRLFLVENDFEAPQWKLSGKQKNILGYVCQEAVVTRDSNTMNVWFTPQIQVQGGPGVFTGFPGMVLAVEMDGGKFQLIATELNKDTFDKTLIAKPSEGKKMSEEKYGKMVEEKMKEMQEQYGGDGHTVIRVVRE